MILLYHPKTSATGKALATALRWHGIKRWKPYCENDTVVRWGNIEEGACGTEINKRKAVVLSGNKLKALQAMRTAGIPVPRATTSADTAKAYRFPVFAREFRHTRGEDIFICRTREDVDHAVTLGKEYFIEYLKPKKEWRLHVMADQIIMAQKKFFDREEFVQSGASEEDSRLIRNLQYGWKFYTVKNLDNVPIMLKTYAIRAVDALGLDFGAVDVIARGRDEEGHRTGFVLEVNSAPGLTDKNILTYVEAFTAWKQGEWYREDYEP